MTKILFDIWFPYSVGEIVGVSCYNDEIDRQKRTIDAAMKDLRPPVLPQDYRLQYCDIEDKDGKKIGNLKFLTYCFLSHESFF